MDSPPKSNRPPAPVALSSSVANKCSGVGVGDGECSVEPVIAHFHATLKRIQVSELERLYGKLPNLNEGSRRELLRFAERLVANVLHPPTELLRDDCSPDSRQELLAALKQLYQLEDV